MNNIAIGSYGPVVNFAGPRAAGLTEANWFLSLPGSQQLTI